MEESKGYLKIGNMYLRSIDLNIDYAFNAFMKNIEFTADRKRALIITKDIWLELKKKLYINLDIDYEKTFFIEKEN